MKEKINVDLYGGKSIFGGRETPLEAEITYCDKYDKCTFYAQGKCFCAGRFKENCKFGSKNRIRGYTSRALKYYDFRDKYRNDECYGKLDEPNATIGKIEDVYVINIGFLGKDDKTGEFRIETHIGSPLVYVEEKELTNDLIKLICEAKPRTLFGYDEIKSYQEKKVPRFLYELKMQFKDVYDKFIKEYPEFKDKKMNFIGRQAYIYSLKDGIELQDKSTFIKKGDCLVSKENWHSAFLPFSAGEAELKIPINKKMTVEIKDNSMVDENTIFRD